MHSVLFIPLLLSLLLSQSTLAAPLASDCTCGKFPLSSRTIDYIVQVTKSRHLTPEECAFICNPNLQPQTQQQQALIAVDSSTTEKSAPSLDAPTIEFGTTEISPPSPDPSTVHAPAQALPSPPLSNSPPILNPPTARPLPLFDAPPSPCKDSDHQRSSPILAKPVSGLASHHGHSQSSMSPVHHKALPPCVFRVAGSLFLLFAVAIGLVEAGSAIMGQKRR